jgi:NADP-dependent 3-hydroxy acid dehydrogenase YdfG
MIGDSHFQVALVTGASSGMDKEIAKRLMRDAFHLYRGASRPQDG